MKFFKPKKTICREDGVPYLNRWNLFECRLFSIKIHQILLSDHDCHHDHPWPFITFLMKGGYVEYRHRPWWKKGGTPVQLDGRLMNYSSKVYSRFSLLYRPANYIHRLEIHQPVWTFVITFKKVREWGFWTPKGWVKWFEYNPTNGCE